MPLKGYFDSIYEDLADISCNNFTNCQIEYTHIRTNETETVDRSEEPPEEIDEDDPIGTDGYVIMTGRFPTIGLVC